jgi:two-component system response regulator BasR
MHILLIEDDLDLGHGLQQALKAEGIASTWVRSIGAAPLPQDLHEFDCALLDVALPDGSGADLLLRWRAGGATLPIIMVTARAGLDERLAGLDGGADDYLAKPFAVPELLSRVRAVMRRYAQQANDRWSVGDLIVEPRAHRAALAGTVLDLSPREFSLLLELARQPGAVVGKAALAQRLAPHGDALDFGALEVHVSNLRRKIGAQRIRTVRGVGYMLSVTA